MNIRFPRTLWQVVKETFLEFFQDKAFRLAAALSYYTIFSLPGVLIIVIYTVGLIYGEKAVRGTLYGQISGFVGPEVAAFIQNTVQSARLDEGGIISTSVGIGILVFGATGVFYQLQDSLNTIWNVRVKQKAGVLKVVKARAIAFVMVLLVGVLLLAFLLVSAALGIVERYLQDWEWLGDEFTLALMQLVNLVVSFATITMLFALMYKVLPDVKVRWKDVWVGAAVTAALFVLGKWGIGFYLAQTNVGSAYGAAGSLIVLLTWIFYSSLIFILGAEFTQVYARYWGVKLEPEEHAEPIDPQLDYKATETHEHAEEEGARR